MKVFLLALVLSCGLILPFNAAQARSIHQNKVANVAGVVQSGAKDAPVTITQTGRFNVGGVIQANRSNSATIRQSGRYNATTVGQVNKKRWSKNKRRRRRR